MKIYNTTDLPTSPEELEAKYGEFERLYIYNGLDNCLTLEVLQQIRPQLDNVTTSMYEFSKELQGPILEMNLTGLLVDKHEHGKFVRGAEADMVRVEKNFFRMVEEGFGLPRFNWRSVPQLMKFLYEDCGLPIQRKKGKPTTERDALEKLLVYFHTEPVINSLLFLRDMKKLLETLATEIDRDGRMRTSFNIAGTETGRLSSSFNPYGTGGNFQNVTELLRRMFVADKGMKFGYIDLEQAESRTTGAMVWNVFHDGDYLDVCESGDPHTIVAKLIWPDLPWTGDLKHDREIADRKFYRHFSYRDLSKRAGHASNYGGKSPTIAKVLKVPVGLVANFQQAYFRAFPGLPRYHDWVAKQVQLEGYLTTPLGFRRYFFGRRDDDTTVREAIAHVPQSMVARVTNQALLNIWRARLCQILIQGHDALLFQYPEEREDELIPQLRKLFEIPIPLNFGRTLIIPNDVKVGWNWGLAMNNEGVLDNPDGLVKYKGHDIRHRQFSPSSSMLDRQFY